MIGRLNKVSLPGNQAYPAFVGNHDLDKNALPYLVSLHEQEQPAAYARSRHDVSRINTAVTSRPKQNMQCDGARIVVERTSVPTYK